MKTIQNKDCIYCYWESDLQLETIRKSIIVDSYSTWSLIFDQVDWEKIIGLEIMNCQTYLNNSKNFLLAWDLFLFKLNKRNKYNLTAQMLQNCHDSLYNFLFSQREEKLFISNDKLTSFLYELMRDHMPCGIVEKLVQTSQSDGESVEYTNGYLAQYAQNLAKKLR